MFAIRLIVVSIFVCACFNSQSLGFSQTTSNAPTFSPLNTGYVRVVPDAGNTAPAGVAILGFTSGGVLITEAGVPSSALIQSGRIFVDVTGSANTGIALANPNATDAVITFYFTDAMGRDFGAGTFRIDGNHQVSGFLNAAPFNLSSTQRGTFTFFSSVPVSAIALQGIVNERNEFLITTMPVSPLGTGFGGSTILFPDFPDAERWTLQVVLVNPGDRSQSGVIQFLGETRNSGIRSARVWINGVSSSTSRYTIPARSAVRMLTEISASTGTVSAVRINPDRGNSLPSGLAIVSEKSDGKTVSMASIAASLPAQAFRTYIESSGSYGEIGSIQSGLTVANPSSSRVRIQMSLSRLDGSSAGLSTVLELPAGGQTTRFANELFPTIPASFKGVMKISAPSPITIVGVRNRFNERGDRLIATTPPWNESAGPTVNELEFPHVLQGGGFSTQLILLSSGSKNTGKLKLLSQDGSPLPGVRLEPTQ